MAMFRGCNLPFKFRYNYDRLLVYGMSGSGKTYLVKRILECMDGNGYRYKILNGNLTDYDKKHIFELIDFDMHKTLKEFIKYGVENAPITLIFEDLTTIFYDNYIPKILQATLYVGRKIGLGFIFVTHRLRRIPSIIPSNSNKVIIFKPTDLRDLQILAIPNISKNIYELTGHQFIYYDNERGDYYIAQL